MRLTAEEFRHWDNKCITLLGMSGVGKTRLSKFLRADHWFHYSGDYRIGSRYLDEPILDNIKQQAMQVPFLRDLLRTDSIYIANNLSFDNLNPVSSFLGKLGSPEKGGLPLSEFKRRQRLHHEAEIAAMLDVPAFIEKAHNIYGYQHFINDAGGSVCELDNPEVMETLAQHSVIVYIQTNEADEHRLIQRAKTAPKPLYYREAFLDQQLAIYMEEQGLSYVAEIDPDHFVRWVFPRLFYARIPRYEALAEKYAYSITTDELFQVQSAADFLALVENAMDRQHGQTGNY
ncbi:MAG: ATPase [bacterium]